jgi:GxxExxY protein
MSENEIGETLLGCAFRVHSALGPGLLESAYEVCMLHELEQAGLDVKRQVPFRVTYGLVELDAGYQLDLLIEDVVIVEVKSVEKLLPIHMAQLLSYLKLSNRKLEYLLNFNTVQLRNGIKRVVNGL